MPFRDFQNAIPLHDGPGGIEKTERERRPDLQVIRGEFPHGLPVFVKYLPVSLPVLIRLHGTEVFQGAGFLPPVLDQPLSYGCIFQYR